jgi:hypothetical protein
MRFQSGVAGAGALRYPRVVRFFALGYILVAAAPLGGCVSTDTCVFVCPKIAAPAAMVLSATLGATVTGSFDLDLHLGPRASGPSTVTLGEFSILDAAQKGTIVTPLSLTGSLGSNIIVLPDSDAQDSFKFNTGTKTLPNTVVPSLCAPAGVVIGGTFQDSLTGMSTPVSSSVFHVSGCQ